MVFKIELNQEELNYLINLVESENKKDWNKAVQDLNINMHPDSLRKSFNVGKYSGYNIYKYMQDKIENNSSNIDSEIKRLEELREKEYQERVKLQDANREKRKYLRDFSRVETIIEYIENKIENRKPITINRDLSYLNNGVNEACLLVSDIHASATVDSQFNKYDTNILKDRLTMLADKTIKNCKKDNVNKLNVEILGDSITGIIHGSTIAQAQDDVIDQIFIVCEALEEFILKLYYYIPNINVYIVYGNHGRVHSNKTDGANKENFERLIAPYLRKDLKNTTIKIIDGGYEDFILYQLSDGRNIVATHGTNDKYLTANKDFAQLLEVPIYEVHMGHLHNPIEINGTVVNGSVMGSDDYSISIRKHTPPIQVLKVYCENDTITYKLNLEVKKKEI